MTKSNVSVLAVFTLQKEIEVANEEDCNSKVDRLIQELENLGYTVDVETVEPFEETPD